MYVKELKDELPDDILIKNTRRLTDIFLEKELSIDMTTKLVKNYTLLYKQVKKTDVKLANLYTPEIYIDCLS